MKKWTKLVTSMIVAGALLGGAGAVYADTTTNATTTNTTTAQQQPAKAQKDHVKLTKEQKQALKAAGIDRKAARAAAQKLNEQTKTLKADLKQLREKVKGNKDLKKQLKQDLASQKDLMNKVRDLRAQDKDLKTQWKSAVQAADAAKIKEVYSKLDANHQQALQLIQQLDTAVKAALQKA